MTQTHPPAPAVIKAESSADFLALLPAFTGYTVSNSLLVIVFQGNLSYGSLRFDLGEGTSPDECVRLAAAAVAVARDISQIDGVAFAIVTDARADPESGAPWQSLARSLHRETTRVGLSLRDSCCVAVDGWCSYLSPEPGFGLRPLAEIEQSIAGLEAAVLSDTAIPDLRQLEELPPVQPARAVAVRGRIDELLAQNHVSSSGSKFTAARLSALADRHTSPATVHDAARLALAASSPSGWVRLATATVVSGQRHQLSYGPDDDPGISSEREVHSLADTLARSGACDDAAELTRENGPLEHVLLLCTSVTPDRDRCRRTIKLLAEVAAHVPSERQPGLRCLIAWLWWWMGLASVASGHVEQALSTDPDDELAVMLRRLVGSGQFPLWTMEPPAALGSGRL